MDNPQMRYLALEPPTQWRAGFAGEGQNRRPFLFDCADCDAREPKIAGIAATGPSYEQLGILTDGPRGSRHAMFCETCFARRTAQFPAASAAGQQQTKHKPNYASTNQDGPLSA